MKITNYKIEKGTLTLCSSVYDLDNVITKEMIDGWQPLGSPFEIGAKDIYGNRYFGQAMVKFEEHK